MTDLDPIAFVRATPPFDRVPARDFNAAVRELEIRFFPAGTRLLQRGAAPLDVLYVIRKGVVRLERDGETLQLLEEGEPIGITSLLANTTPLDVVVDEDLLAYALPRAAVQALLQYPAFAAHFAAGLGERLRGSLERTPAASYQADLSTPVATLVTRALVEVSAEASIGEAARLMRDRGVSAVIVATVPPGILTDRDLRNRVLAAGLCPDVLARDFCSSPLRTVPAETPVYEAWQVLLDAGVHHLPVTRGDALIGMITGTDLLRHGAQGPVAVLRGVERLTSRDNLPGYSARVADMAASLLAGGLDATVIAGFVSRLNDALVAVLLRWAEDALGTPPCPYAWVVVGSEGRREQTLLTDQDNALVWADGLPDPQPYFASMAEQVVADLVTAGFPRCPGDTMATHWHGSLSVWLERFRGWIDEPSPQALLEAATFFDFRPVFGSLDLSPLEALLDGAREQKGFLRCLAKAALDARPPNRLRLGLRGSSSGLDLKREGLSAVVMLARCYGLEVGARTRNTLERLSAAARGGLLDDDGLGAVSESYAFLLRLRLREQLRQLAAGATPQNEITMSQLSASERRGVKDAFSTIRHWQDAAANHYQTSMM